MTASTIAATLTFDHRDGMLIALWRGERIGHFDYVSGVVVSGCAIYGTEVYSTDDICESGVPFHSVEPAIQKMCEAVDEKARRAA